MAINTILPKMTAIMDLVPSPQNSRTHPTTQIEKIARSIQQFGFLNPIIIAADKTIIAGHGRLAGAKLLGMTDVPCILADHLTDDQRRAYMLADNRIALDGGYDEEILAAELAALMASDFDLALTGFDDDELANLLNDPDQGLTDADDVPEPPVDPITRLGDIWILGDHRIICGDSTSADTVKALLGDAVPHLMVTDPPYGVEYDASWRTSLVDPKNGKNKTVHAVGKVLNDDRADWREAWALFPGDVCYVWHVGNKAHIVAESLIESDFNIRAHIIWAKSHFAIGRGDYHSKHEPCWYAVRDKGKSHWQGSRKETTVWEIDKPQKSETGHSTQKPVECMRKPIENNSLPGDAIYEPFSGSGTTIIACEATGRKCFAIELNPAYVDMAVQRWENYTGKKAILESNGQEFAKAA